MAWYWSVLLSVAGVAAGILVPFRLTGRRRPVWLCQSTQLISNARERADGLAIAYDGEDVDALQRTMLIFYNAGREPIMEGYLAAPAAFAAPEGRRILGAKAVHSSTATVGEQLEVAGDRSLFTLGFRHLGGRQGVAVEVFSDMGEGEQLELVGGEVLGSGGIHKGRTETPKLYYTLSVLLTGIVPVFICFLIKPIRDGMFSPGPSNPLSFFVWFTLCISFIALFVLLSKIIWSVPREFRKYLK